MLRFGKQELSFEKGKANDWLLANGIGGYSSSTAIGLNTRKYHGLLVGADESLERTLYLSKMEETLVLNGQEFPLSINQYLDGVIHPEGHNFLESFELSDLAKFTYKAEGATLEKTVMPVRGENTVLINYRVHAPSSLSASLLIRPLVNIRNFHENTRGAQEYSHKKIGNGFLISEPKLLYSLSDTASYMEDPQTYYNMLYERERERQAGELDDHFSPGFFSLGEGKREANIISSTGEINFERIKNSLAQEAQRKKSLIENYFSRTGIPKNQFILSLLLASDSFIIEREGKKSILAGYHWFSEWSRDALLSLPGLLLSTERTEEAREALLNISSQMKEGTIPNTHGSDELNADSPLLYINACYLLFKKSGDSEFLKNSLWEKMKEAHSSYLKGNDYYQIDATDLLVRTKKEGLTWMDAKGQDGAFTPRKGKPVEINALWFNATRILAELSDEFEPSSKAAYNALGDKIRASFQKFWNPKKKALYDLLEPEDDSTRPNQIFAVSLPFSPLSPEQQKGVLARVFNRLYTPVGLRSLSPSSPNYKEYYSGSQEERDSAYHNGTIWPYLLGAFVDAHKRVFRRTDAGAIELIEPFEENIRRYGIGTANEIFEAKTMRPDGCISQAWTVAELIRIYTQIKTEGMHWM